MSAIYYKKGYKMKTPHIMPLYLRIAVQKCICNVYRVALNLSRLFDAKKDGVHHAPITLPSSESTNTEHRHRCFSGRCSSHSPSPIRQTSRGSRESRQHGRSSEDGSSFARRLRAESLDSKSRTRGMDGTRTSMPCLIVDGSASGHPSQIEATIERRKKGSSWRQAMNCRELGPSVSVWIGVLFLLVEATKMLWSKCLSIPARVASSSSAKSPSRHSSTSCRACD